MALAAAGEKGTPTPGGQREGATSGRKLGGARQDQWEGEGPDGVTPSLGSPPPHPPPSSPFTHHPHPYSAQ